MCSCDGLGREQPSLESGLYVPRVTDWNWNLKMMPEILKKSKQKLKKPVFRKFLVGTYGVAQRTKKLPDYRSDGSTDLQADSRVGGSHGGLRPPFSRNFCRTDQIRFLKEILKTLTQKATYYTLSVTSWTRRKPQPLSRRGRRWWLWRTCTP